MVTRSRKAAPKRRPAPVTLVSPTELPERTNRDFDRRHGDSMLVSERIRLTSQTRFLARWSAP